MKIKTEFIYDDKTEVVEVIKQEIVDEDKDWNLAKQKENTEMGVCEKSDYFYTLDVKKCRDLIIKDFLDNSIASSETLQDIVNRRFGDL